MAKDAETTFALGLLDTVRERGFAVANAIMDAGYDNGPIHDGCMDRGICPVTPLRARPRASRVATTSPASASTASGRSPGPTTSGRPPSGAARLASATKVDVGQGRPDARADPTPHGAVAQALREPWRCRARVRSAKARMGDAAAARARNRARAPARRPDDPRQARLRALTSARRPSLPQGRGRRRRSKTRQTTSAIKAAVSETPLGLSRRPIATWTFNSSLMTSASSSQRRRSSGLSGSSSTRTTLAPRFANRFVKPS